MLSFVVFRGYRLKKHTKQLDIGNHSMDRSADLMDYLVEFFPFEVLTITMASNVAELTILLEV